MNLDESNVDIFTKELKKVAEIDALISETKNLMKPLQDRLKVLKLERKELEKEICPTMEKNDLKIAELPNNIGIIQYTVRKSMLPITQKTIKEKTILFFKEGPGSYLSFNSKKPEEKGNDLYDYIYGKQNRQYIKKEQLKSKDIKL